MPDAILIARAPRWCYVAAALAAALVIALFVRILAINRLADLSLVATVAIMLLVAGWAFVCMTARVISPPTLMQADTGLVLSVGGRRRRWDWRRIASIRRVETRGGAFAAIDWCRSDGARLQSTWLNYPFPYRDGSWIERLQSALAAARASGSAAPLPRPFSSEDWQRKKRLNKHFIRTLTAAGIVFAVWVIGINTYPTTLLTPVDPLWLQSGVSLGLLFGALVPLTLARAVWAKGPEPMPLRTRVIQTALVAMVTLPYFALVGESAGSGLADAYAFSQGPYKTTESWLRVRGWSCHKGCYARVHPFSGGPSVELPLSIAEYDRLAEDHSDRWTYGYCYPVTLDRTRRAVRVHVPRRLPVGGVRPCTASASDVQ